MNIATRLGIFLVVGGLAAATFSLTGAAFAERPDDPNFWGKEASDLARADGPDTNEEENEAGSEMGEHSRDPFTEEIPDTTPDREGRLGIGNLPGHPSESIQLPFLCGEGGEDCPEEVID